ncbi:MAG: RNA polymerase sigma factor [Akkermansiaceae bacterium]|nr:RNA polymerase sigma factor [Akkermansiaceae bacterium]
MKRGDERAFASFHQAWFDRLFRYHMALASGNETMAKDAMQETLLRVVRYVKVFKDETVFWCWLTRLAKSSIADQCRQQGRFQRLRSRLLARDTTPDVPDEDGLLAALERGLGELREDDRKLIEGKYFEGRSVRDLAQEKGLTEKAVESRLGRIRGKIKNEIETKQL